MIHDVVIYKANETNFNHEGLGVLIDFVEDVEVTENNRGFFELKFTYSLNGKLAQSIKEEAYIKTVANERQEEPLIFRIYQCEPDYIERLIYVRARLKIIDDMMNSVHKSIVFPKSFGITPIIEGLFKNAVPSLNYRLSGSVNNLHDISHEDDTVYEHLFQENGLFVMNDITPLYTPLGMTITTTRGNKRVDTITEQDFINKFKIIRERKNMITAIIPWTVTKKDEFVANEEDARRSYRDTVEEKVYGEIIVSPKVASHGYPFIAKFMEFKNEVTREWEENNRTMREYKYQSVEDLNKASQNFFTENKGIDEYSIEASIETLGLHMDYMKRLSSLGLYDEVEFYLEEHDLKIVLAVSEVTYSPSLDMNLALTFQSNTNTLSKAGQRINANAPSERDLQNLIERERLKEIVRNYIDKDDGTRTYWVSELPDPATAGEQDIAFLETAEGKSIWVLINGVWVEKLPLNFEERLRDELERVDTQTQAMEAAIQANEAKAREALEQAGASADLASEAQRIADEAKQAHATLSQEVSEAKADLVQKGEQLVQIQNQYTSIEQWKQATDPRLNQIVSDARNVLNQVNTLDGRLDTVEPVLDELGRQIGTKLTQADLSGYVTSTQLTAKAGELTQEISRVQGLIPTQIGGRNYILNSDVYTTSGSKYFDLSQEFLDYAQGGKYVTISLDIKGENLIPNDKGLSRIGCELRLNLSDGKTLYLQCQKIVSGTQPRERISVTRQIPVGTRVTGLNKVNMYVQVNGAPLAGRPKFELSSVPSDWSPAPEDVPTYAVVNEIKRTADSNSATIRDTQGNLTDLTQTVNTIKASVEQTILDPNTGKIAQLQSQITQQAGEISQRLTRTEVESAITGKGYQTKTQVDSNITGRGYITNSALEPYATTVSVENKVRETADGINRTITEVRGLIPTQIGGTNLLRGTISDWRTIRVNQSAGAIKTYNSQEWALLGIKTGDSVTFSVDVKTTSGKKLRSRISFYGPNKHYYSETFVVNGEGRLSATGIVPDGITRVQLFVDANLTAETNTGITDESYRREKLEIGAIPTDWTPAPEDLTLPFESFKNEYDRTAKSVIDNLSSVIQTDSQWYTTINNRLRTAEGNFDTLSRTTMPNLIDAKIAANNQIKDTRNDNQPPQWYWTNYPKQTVEELKLSSVIGVSGSTYAMLTTEVLWHDASAGKVKQTAKTDTGTYERQGTGTTWDAWVKTANATDLGRYTPLTTFQTVQTTTELYERILGKSEGDIQTNASRLVMTSDVFQTEVKRQETNADILSRVSDGVSVVDDPMFDIGLNGIVVYYRTKSGDITITRQTNTDLSQPNGKLNRLMVTHTGTASPNYGGVCRILSGPLSVNAMYVVDFTAMLPVGRFFSLHYNQIGTGGSVRWVTSNQGTGQWTRYVGVYTLGTGTIGPNTLAYLSVGGGATPTASNPLVWYLQSLDIRNITQSSSQALSTKVTQLAGSWAVQNLTSAGTVLNQINLLADGTNRIDGRLTHITGQTKIDNAVITSAMIQSIDAGKITAGTLDASKANIANLNINSLVGNKSEFIRSGWNAINSRVSIDGTGLKVTHTDGSYTMIGANGLEMYIGSTGYRTNFLTNAYMITGVHNTQHLETYNKHRYDGMSFGHYIYTLPTVYQGRDYSAICSLSDVQFYDTASWVLQRVVSYVDQSRTLELRPYGQVAIVAYAIYVNTSSFALKSYPVSVSLTVTV